MNKEILNLDEAADLFGVSIKTFIKLLKEEKVPARKIGREWRFSRNALIKWLSEGNSQIYSSSELETKDFFNNVAFDWDKLRKKYFDDSIIKNLIDMNVLNKDMVFLDVGAGDGYISIPISKKVDKVYAVDISESMLGQLDNNIKKSKINNIELIEADGLNIPLKDESVDFICACFYLHHIEVIDKAFIEFYRLLKKGGYLFIVELYEHDNEKFIEEMHDYWAGFNVDKLSKVVKKNKFDKIKIKEVCKIKKEDIGVFTLISNKS